MSGAEEPVIIVADDEPESREIVQKLAHDAGLQSIGCRNAQSAIEAIDRFKGSRVLVGVATDLRMPGIRGASTGGWQVINHAYEASKSLNLALFTGTLEGDLQTIFNSSAAIPAFKVFIKNADEDKLAVWMKGLRADWDDGLQLALRDANTRQIYETLVPTYAASNLPVLLLGESGTGKEGLATHIHNKSKRAGPFVPINSGGLESQFAFAELFGHTASAFADVHQHELGQILHASGYKSAPTAPSEAAPETFADWFARGNPDIALSRDGLLSSRAAQDVAGTLFLDEVATLPPRVMAGLLRVLETGEVIPFGHHGPGIKSHCRIIAATNEMTVVGGAVEATADRSFRPDLFYRMAGAIFTLPPLRERDADDIRTYLKKIVWVQLRVPPIDVTRKALQKAVELYQNRNDRTARQYQRGNFRSLRNLAYRAYLIARTDGSTVIDESHIDLAVEHGQIIVPSVTRGDDKAHIRSVFRAALRERQQSIREEFTRKDLKDFTQKHPVETAFAFLQCALIERDGGGGDQYFHHNEIESALNLGRVSRNSYLTKTLLAEHLCAAAKSYLEKKLPEILPTRISDVLALVRQDASVPSVEPDANQSSQV